MPRRNRRSTPRSPRPVPPFGGVIGTSLRAQRKATSRRALCQSGVVAFARVPFREDPRRYKIRPVVVIGWSADGKLLDVRPVTSKVDRVLDGHVLVHWNEAGLSRPCAVLPRTLRIERYDFQGALGELHPDDQAAIGRLRALTAT